MDTLGRYLRASQTEKAFMEKKQSPQIRRIRVIMGLQSSDS